MGRLLSVLVVCSIVPLHAAASATPEPSPPEPLPGLVVTGTAVLEDVHVSIACARTDLANASSLCRVVVLARLRAVDEISIRVPPAPAITTLDGALATDFVSLEAGRSAALSLTFERALSIGSVDREAPWILPAPRARHLLLGESTALHRTDDGASGELFGGAELEVAGALHVEVDRGVVDVSVGGQSVTTTCDVRDPRGAIRLAIDGGDDPSPILQNGGPFVGLGFWGPLVGDEGRLQLRAGYEIALADWVMASIAFETDFDSIAESVLVEVATPELLVIIPSISAGIGAVFRQLGNRTADAALRLALGYQVTVFGVYVDFDYWPDISDWTLAAGGRLSI